MPSEVDIYVLPGDPPLSVHWRRTAQARRMSLRVSRLDGRITLTLPPRASTRMAEAFLIDRADWLRRALEDMPCAQPVGPGTTLPVEGQALTLTATPGLRLPQVEGGHLLVPAKRPATAVRAWLIALARDRLATAVAGHAATLGRPAGTLRLRDTRSRWGSCAANGDLMFSWRLIMAPPAVLDYVAAHEVAHLAQMNHSPAFWDQVARLMPGYGPHRAWLRSHGGALHRYRFDATA